MRCIFVVQKMRGWLSRRGGILVSLALLASSLLLLAPLASLALLASLVVVTARKAPSQPWSFNKA